MVKLQTAESQEFTCTVLDAEFPSEILAQCEQCTLKSYFNNNINISKLLLHPKSRFALCTNPKNEFLDAALLAVLTVPSLAARNTPSTSWGRRGTRWGCMCWGGAAPTSTTSSWLWRVWKAQRYQQLQFPAGICSLQPLGLWFCPLGTHPHLISVREIGFFFFSPSPLCRLSKWD